MTTAPDIDVLVVGDVLVDELRDSEGSIESPGGSALNVAVGFAVLGHRAALVGPLAPDAGGALIETHLRSHEVRFLPSSRPRRSPRAISERIGGEPTYSFNAEARDRRFPIEGPLEQRPHLIAVSGFPFDDATQVDGVLGVVGPSAVALDANPRPGLLVDRDRFAAGFLRAGAQADLVKIGEDDAALIFATSAREAARRFLTAGAALVLVTEGARGARLIGAGFEVVAGIADAEGPVVDTMGAGDATFAAVASTLLVPVAERDWAAALGRAMEIAAVTIRAPGGVLRMPRESGRS